MFATSLSRRFRELGFKFVTLDLEGFRSGSLNDLVSLDIRARYQELGRSRFRRCAMTPMPAPRVLDMFFLEARSKLLDLAATLDRLDRGDGSAAADPRVEKHPPGPAHAARNRAGPGRAGAADLLARLRPGLAASQPRF